MNWKSAENPPEREMLCIVLVKRADGSLFIPNHPVNYTTGTEFRPGVIEIGFSYPRTIKWFEIPKPYTEEKKGWILFDEKYPEVDDRYLVSSYDNKGRQKVGIAFFNEKEYKFWGWPDVIAWQKIPKF